MDDDLDDYEYLAGIFTDDELDDIAFSAYAAVEE